MRAFWSLFLTMGLLATVLSVLDRRAAQTTDEPAQVHTMDDGSGIPPAYPTPKSPTSLP